MKVDPEEPNTVISSKYSLDVNIQHPKRIIFFGPGLAGFQRHSQSTVASSRGCLPSSSAEAIQPFDKIPSNSISTARYSVWSFLPRQLFHQFFSKMANLYFLFISILQQNDGWSPTGKYTTIGPLALFVSLAMLREAWDDYKRHRSDYEENNRRASVVQCRQGLHCQFHERQKEEGLEKYHNRIWQICTSMMDSFPRFPDNIQLNTVPWKSLRVGDVVKVSCDEPFPSDLIFLQSSRNDGTCSVETANLDGETNLKQKQAVHDTQTIPVDRLCGSLETELPNNDLYNFDGSLEFLDMTSDSAVRRKVPVTINNLLVRGSVLKNTDHVYGIVVMSGEDTKIRKNATAKIVTKSAFIEKSTNKLIWILFLVIIVLASVSTFFSREWVDKNGSKHRYVQDRFELARAFFSFLILYNSFIPISLYVLMEMIKLVQAYLMTQDMEMYDPNADCPMEARTSSLNEDLGQVSFVFSDKTGTLTENVMTFKNFTANGISHSLSPETKKSCKDAINGKDKKLHDVLLAMTLCHTALPLHYNGAVKFQVSSPDEEAILDAMRDLGYLLNESQDSKVSLLLQGDASKKMDFELLATIEFNSTRKRMSTIYKYPDGRIVLLCKGADSIIMQRLGPSDILETTKEHINRYSVEGLRVLMYGMRVLTEKEFNEWLKIYKDAQLSIDKRQILVDAAAELIEKNLTLLGGTAIEDKLQEGVPETLDTLRQAGIRLWVLTGDKRETAINIGYSSNLIKSFSTVHQIDWKEMNGRKGVKDYLKNFHASVMPEKVQQHHVIVIDGETLSKIEADKTLLVDEPKSHSLFERKHTHTHVQLFISACIKANAVICCRVSPRQKALIITWVKQMTNGEKVTLAIGDGANDVAMIKEAHVGIGISGREGLQAARSSDYSISRFRFLTRLLLVHGHWSYVRVSKFIVASFYKVIMFYLTQLLYQFFDGFSGTTMFESWTLAGYNVFFSSLAVMCIGILEQDFSAPHLLANPDLYQLGVKNELYNVKVISRWLFYSIYQAVAVFYIPVVFFGFIFDSSSFAAESSWIVLGTVVYTAVVLCVNINILYFESTYWAWISQIIGLLTIVFWFVFNYVYSHMWTTGTFGYENFQLFDGFTATASPILISVLACFGALLPSVILKPLVGISTKVYRYPVDEIETL